MTTRTRVEAAFISTALVIAACAVLLVYRGRIDVGLYYDDFHFVRPSTSIDLHRVWYGSWDPTGTETAYFRPLTAWLYAARFSLFGLNTTAMHAVSVAAHAGAAVLLGWFLRRERCASPIAWLGVWFYAVHPAMPYAQVSWLANQMHLLESLLVLTTLLVWQAVRDRHPVWWLPLLALASVTFLVKEDGIALLPALVALTWLRGAVIGPMRWRRSTLLAIASFTVVVGLFYFRQTRLAGGGGFGMPNSRLALSNFGKGLRYTLTMWPGNGGEMLVATAIVVCLLGSVVVAGGLQRGRRLATAVAAAAIVWGCIRVPWATLSTSMLGASLSMFAAAAGVSAAVLSAGGWTAAVHRDRQSLWLICAGVLLLLCFNLPFVLATKREQYHLVTLGAVIAFVGGAQALTRRIAEGVGRSAAIAFAFVATVPHVVVARATAADFLPCARMVRAADADVHQWSIVPDGIKGWLDTKADLCRAHEPIPSPSTMPVVAWGVGEETQDKGSDVYRWTRDQVTLLTHNVHSISLELRKPGANAAQPVHVLAVSGRTPVYVALETPDWKSVTIEPRSDWRSWFRDGDRIDITVSPPSVPALIKPETSDLRWMGVELRVVSIR